MSSTNTADIQHPNVTNNEAEMSPSGVEGSRRRQSSDAGRQGSFLSNFVSGKTPGVRNIEAAYVRAGASTNHTPGYASKLGDQKDAPVGQGVGSQKFADGIQTQRTEVRSLSQQ